MPEWRSWRALPGHSEGSLNVRLPRHGRSAINNQDFLARPLPRCLLSALHYADRGWLVFPVPPGTKKWHKAAEHAAAVRRWGASSNGDEIRKRTSAKSSPKPASAFRLAPKMFLGIDLTPSTDVPLTGWRRCRRWKPNAAAARLR